MGEMADYVMDQEFEYLETVKPRKGRKMTTSNKNRMPIELKKCTTPKFRVSFPHVFEKHTGFKGQEPKYSISMLFDKATDLKELKRAANNAAIEAWGKDTSQWPEEYKKPFRDGDKDPKKRGKPEYKNVIFVGASSNQKPQVIGPLKVEGQFPHLTKDDGEFYPGCYARATLIAFAYDTGGNVGISFALQNIQKLEDGENLSGRKSADEEFDEVDDGSDDRESYGNDESDMDPVDAEDVGF